MMPVFNLEPTKENIDYVEKMMDLCSDYEHGFITVDGFIAELGKLNGGEL